MAFRACIQALLTVCPLFAQIDLTFKTLNVRPIVGRGSHYQVWMVRMTSNYPVPKVIDQERIMRAALAIHEIPGAAARDLLDRQARTDPRNRLVRIVDAATPAIATGTATYGLAKKQDYATGIGLGVGLVALIRATALAGAPAPAPYYGDQLPARVALGPLGSVTYVLLADFDSQASTIDTQIFVP